jgi:hypothetical protein
LLIKVVVIETADDQHLAVGKPAWLFGQMMVFYLKRAVEGVCF